MVLSCILWHFLAWSPWLEFVGLRSYKSHLRIMDTLFGPSISFWISITAFILIELGHLIPWTLQLNL